jgi:hypothetical protein
MIAQLKTDYRYAAESPFGATSFRAPSVSKFSVGQLGMPCGH